MTKRLSVLVLTAALMAMLVMQPFGGLFPKAFAEATLSELDEAMDLPGIVSIDLGTSSQDGVDVQFTAAGGFPTNHISYVVLSTGNASEALLPNDSSGRSFELDGLDTPGEDQGNDMVQFTLVLDTSPLNPNFPDAATAVSFDWKFYSEEWPEFVNSEFNDAFLVELGSSNILLSGNQVTAPNNIAFDENDNLITINTSGALGMRGNDPFFDCTTDPDITDPLCDEPARVAGTTYDGATPTLKTTVPIPDDATSITLIFSLFDMGGSSLDSTVFIDNLSFETTDIGGGPTTKISSDLVCTVPATAAVDSSLDVSTSLKDATTLAPISGATIEWSITPSGPTTSSITDSSGVSTASLDLTGLAPGIYAAKADFAGDSTYQQDSCGLHGAGIAFFIRAASVQPVIISIFSPLTGLTEGDSGTKNFDFTVIRSGDLSGISTVQFATEDGTGAFPPSEAATSPSDYTAIPLTTLSFAADETTKTITVLVNGDTEIEPNEIFNVNLSDCAGCTIGDFLGVGVGAILDDDTPPPSTFISINSVSLTEGDSGTKNFDFTVTRSGDTSGESTVDFATSPPDENTAEPFTDYIEIPLTTLSFPADETSMTITVVVNGDTEIETDETFSVLLSNCSDCALTFPAQGGGTIENDDFVSGGTTTLAPEKDSFIRSSAKDTNAGANEVLILQKSGDKKSLVSFDLSPFQTQQVSDAKLRLFVTYNGGNWGPEGRTIAVHKLLSDWTEGNGIDSVPIAIDPSVVKQRGTGEGVTWGCPFDANIANTQPDCSLSILEWNGGYFESTASDLVLITSTTVGVWIAFDVTEDVNSFLDVGPTDNFGWLIKKSKQSEIGQIAFASKESTEVDQRPQLVLTFG
jgi:hypothetical protein